MTTPLVLTAWLAVAAVAAQDPLPQRQPHFALGGEVLARPAAVLDPHGGLTLTGTDRNGAARTLALRFPALALPRPGEAPIGVEALSGSLDGTTIEGTLTVQECTLARVVLQGRLAGDVAVAADLVPSLPPATIEGTVPTGPVAPVRDQRDREDFVFCALGNGGTGWPGQVRVGASIARLAPTGPLDCVLLLGDNVLPGGPKSLDDPRWIDCFERPYPDLQLPMMFYAVMGDRDRPGESICYEQARINPRFQIKPAAHSFTIESHGKKILVVGFDTDFYTDRVGNPLRRHTSRAVLGTLGGSDADLKILFGHHPIVSHGDEADSPKTRALQESCRLLGDAGVDLYLCAGDHHLSMHRTPAGFLQVTSGGGAGPDLIRSAKWGEDTLFAHAGGGFAWGRFDGRQLELSLRDSDGKVLFVQHVPLRQRR